MSTEMGIGNKLYNYCYGPMTIVATCTVKGVGSQPVKCVCCTVDDVEGCVPQIQMYYETSSSQNSDPYLPDANGRKYVKYLENDIGKVVFTSPKDALKFQAKPEWTHSCFGGKKATLKESAVGAIETSAMESAVVALDDVIQYTGESGVGAVD